MSRPVQFTWQITVDQWINLGAEMVAAGYPADATAELSQLQIVNKNSETVYVHATENAVDHPGSGEEVYGIEIGSDAPSKEWFFEKQYSEAPAINSTKVWLYAPNPTPVKIMALGGR